MSQETGSPLPGGKPGWLGGAPPSAFPGLQVQCVQKGMFPEQFSIFSLLGFMQHPMRLKPEDKGEVKWTVYIFSPILYAVHLSHIPSYSLLLYRKEISAAMYAAEKGGSQPCKPSA